LFNWICDWASRGGNFGAYHDELEGLLKVTDIRFLQRQFEKLATDFSKAAGETKIPTFREFATQYEVEKLSSTSLREATKRAFEYQLRCNLIPRFGDLALNKVTNLEWNSWVTEMRNLEDCSITRFFNARKCLVEILHAAQEAGHIERVPKLENPDEPRNVGRILEDREVFAILRNTTYRLFRMFFYVMYKMGIRPREILRWEWSMIEWNPGGKNAWIDVPARITKTGRTRRIPINSSVTKHLRRLFESLERDPVYVFPNRVRAGAPQLSYHGAWKTACEKAGVAKCVPYDLRRTFITRAAANNHPLLYVAKGLDTSTKMIEGTYAKAQVQVMETIVG
jgi:integrase